MCCDLCSPPFLLPPFHTSPLLNAEIFLIPVSGKSRKQLMTRSSSQLCPAEDVRNLPGLWNLDLQQAGWYPVTHLHVTALHQTCARQTSQLQGPYSVSAWELPCCFSTGGWYLLFQSRALQITSAVQCLSCCMRKKYIRQ